MRKLFAVFAVAFTFLLVSPNTARAADVCDIQEELQNLGYYDGQIDCTEGPQTYRAIRNFQARHNLDVDGIAGEETLGRLFGRPRYAYQD